MIIQTKKIFFNKISKCLFIICLSIIIFSCNSYKWDSEIKEMTNGNLKEWLRKAPFDNLWDIQGENRKVVTNLKTVFPFYKGFDYKNGIKVPRDSIYKNEVLIIKDSLGEGFVYSALLNSNQKIYLKDSYYERGNIIFSGMDSYNDSHQAHLKKRYQGDYSNYFSEIYDVTIMHNYRSENFILCHYQKDKFLFQLAFINKPKQDPETFNYEYDYLKIIKKIKAINKEMKLNIKEWENLTVSDLKLLNK